MGIRLYNTLSRKKEDFTPVVPGQVKMYLCGPTVYDFLHVGNFRGPIVFNLFRNWFEYRGHKVTFVYNYTDVDDKIIERANERGIATSELTKQFIAEFEKDFKSLGLKPHERNPRVTEFMDEIVSMVSRLVENKKAYVVGGDVFYSVEAFQEYGKLSHKKIDELQVGARVEIGTQKKNPLDFSLWKPAKPGEPKWPSPWGEGRPGWHIECSAMSHKLLGDTFDIHGGGIDLIFPHHENEIAQSESCTGKPMAKYWVHNNFINMGSEKMSKSLGNLTTTRQFLTTYNAEILKYMILLAHYRSNSDFSVSQIHNAIRALARVYSCLATLDSISEKPVAGERDAAFDDLLVQAQKQFAEALDDDFNTPEAFARIFEMIRTFNSGFRLGQKVTPHIRYRAEALKKWILATGQFMALFQEPASKFLRTLDDMLLEQMNLKRSEVEALVKERTDARAAKDFKKSDELRAKLVGMGIAIQDGPEGTVWEVQK